MINYSLRYSAHPEDVKSYDTEKLRAHFLIETLFTPDEINIVYSMYDRYIVGGIMPVKSAIKLDTIPYLKSEYFLGRRELGVINVGEKGIVSVDGEIFELGKKEALYVGKGAKEILFSSAQEKPALFYINSAPAHRHFPNKKVS